MNVLQAHMPPEQLFLFEIRSAYTRGIKNMQRLQGIIVIKAIFTLEKIFFSFCHLHQAPWRLPIFHFFQNQKWHRHSILKI